MKTVFHYWGYLLKKAWADNEFNIIFPLTWIVGICLCIVGFYYAFAGAIPGNLSTTNLLGFFTAIIGLVVLSSMLWLGGLIGIASFVRKKWINYQKWKQASVSDNKSRSEQ